jgi:hypothetical protein
VEGVDCAWGVKGVSKFLSTLEALACVDGHLCSLFETHMDGVVVLMLM